MSDSSKGGPGEGQGAREEHGAVKSAIDELSHLRPDSDLVCDNLDVLMGYVSRFALENFEDAQRCADADVRAGIARHAVKLAESYAKLMTARDKHRKAMGRG